jgi:hypothetical protein
MALAAPVISHAGTDQYIYRAGDSTGTNLFSTVETPAGRAAPLGYFIVRPVGTSFTLNVDDQGTLDGLEVAVSAHKARSGRFLFKGCLPVRSTRTITGATPGAEVVIWIENLGPRSFPGACSGMATAGIATVTGIR